MPGIGDRSGRKIPFLPFPQGSKGIGADFKTPGSYSLFPISKTAGITGDRLMKKARWFTTVLFLLEVLRTVSVHAVEGGELTLQTAQSEAVEHSPRYLQMTYREKELGWKQQEAFATF